MRLGFYGGMANNLYVVARAFSELGAQVLFIRDRGNTSVFSQPSWQDVRTSLSQEEWGAAEKWDWNAWRQWEAAHGWSAPPWLADPLDSLGPLPALDAELRTAALIRFLYRNSPHAGAVLRQMRTCDGLAVCGIHATILAMASGRPYCIWPHGADIRMAAGLCRPAPGASLRTRAAARLTRRLLRRAYGKARFAIYANPTAGGGHAGDILHGALGCAFRHIPFPVPLATPPDPADKPDILAAALREAGADVQTTGVNGFAPSRLDFHWKGQDLLLRALARTPKTGSPRLLFAGWGADLPKARALSSAPELKDRAVFIPRVFSKPLLCELFRGADFAVDQFRSGHSGTTALEAMGCGTPVLMHVDSAGFEREGLPAPPVIEAADENGIADFFASLPGREELAAQGAHARRWLGEHHDARSALKTILTGLAPRRGGKQ